MSASGIQQGNGNVIDIGAGGTGDNQTAGFLQCMIGIVVLEDSVDTDSLSLQRTGSLVIHITAGGIGGTVGTVGTNAEDSCTGDPVDALCRSQSQLLIPSALAMAGQMDDRRP